jgi:hypothetical protein
LEVVVDIDEGAGADGSSGRDGVEETETTVSYESDVVVMLARYMLACIRWAFSLTPTVRRMWVQRCTTSCL